MNIALDVADPAQAARMPAHGRAKNSQGVTLLWLPIRRLLHEAPSIRKARGFTETLSLAQLSEIRAFDATLDHLVLALRNLHNCVRIGADPRFGEQDQEKWYASHEASSLIPLFFDLTVVYIRRLADFVAMASRYVLFKTIESAPRDYKKLRKRVANRGNLQHLNPMCDNELLQEAYAKHSGWFNKLRNTTDENGEMRNGIRDIMEHHPAPVTVTHAKAGDGPWQVMVNLGEGINASFCPDLIPTLREILADLANLWTGVCVATGLRQAERPWIAPIGDAVLLRPMDEDSTGFWPEI
jgi:hypothetical protein